MKKLVLAFLLFASPVFAQNGAYSSPASGSGSGAQTPTSVSGTTVGIFTNGAPTMNQNFLFSTTGGGTCNTLNILGLGSPSTVGLTDGIASCLNTPTSGVTNGFSSGFGSYVQVNQAGAGGQFGWEGGIGYYSQVFCNASGSPGPHCWGANFSVSDAATKPASIFGNEYDITINNNTSVGAGTVYSFRGNGQPTADTMPTITVQQGAGTGRFTSGFRCEDGSMSSGGNFSCVKLGQQATGSAQDSQSIFWRASQGGVGIHMSLHLLQDNFMDLAGPAWTIVNTGAGNPETFGVALKATSALSVNQLVKVDTANADSVVVCTTVDTLCIGFVQGGSVFCAAGGNFCGINTVPGSKAVGILGTTGGPPGQCAIGNFVIVDTTTNGRVKCTAAQPAVGAWIGIALSAQTVVGNTVDILTKFQ